MLVDRPPPYCVQNDSQNSKQDGYFQAFMSGNDRGCLCLKRSVFRNTGPLESRDSECLKINECRREQHAPAMVLKKLSRSL
jgi:hypothetical protein